MRTLAEWLTVSGPTFNLLATIGAMFSLIWNTIAAFRTEPPWRRMYGVTAFFSLLYVAAWGSLVIDPLIDRAQWSEAVTPISLTSFFVIWSGPAAISIIHRRHRDEAIKEISTATKQAGTDDGR